MEQKRPADIIQELLDYLWNGLGLEEKGWKRLKKGDFKKKMKNGLTYQIWFDRSRYNYIDYEIGHGNVEVGFSCIIKQGDDYLYSFRIEPTTGGSFFRMLTEDLRLNTGLLDTFLPLVKANYLDFIDRFEADPVEALQPVCAPFTEAEDYSWFIYVREQMVERYGTAEQMEEYRRQAELRGTPGHKAKNWMGSMLFHLSHANDVDQAWASSRTREELDQVVEPFVQTLNDLLDEYMSIYGVNTWAMSTYESRRGLARNYITPIIGDMLLSDITPRMMDKYYRDLLSVKTVSVNNRKPTSEYLTPHTVREIHKLLRSAFNQAVRWELISRNPVLNATLPKEEHKERDIWTAETLSKAMEVCDDPILSLALNLAFSCSLRIGEMLGLTWDCIDIAPQSIENGSAYIFVNKELQRVTRGALDDLSDKGVIKKFPPCIASTHTALVLKEPKTKTSIRRVYLPKTVAYMLVERKKEIDELMDLFGDEYIDNNLVFCSSNGRPMESQVINRAFNKLIKENGLPHVVFHSLRHSSITYKLKLNGGDMKSVQGDSGHAQVKMVADVYSHIIDEDRCINAQRLEEAFYSSKTPDPVEDTEPKTADTAVTESDESDAAKILELLKNPETAALLKQLAKAL